MPYAHVHFACLKQTPLYYVIFFQVEFMHVSTVVAIQTQGRAQILVDRWVWTYRVEYSRDCVKFNSVLDVNGNNKVPRCHVLYDVLNVAPYYIIVLFYCSYPLGLSIVCCLHLKIKCRSCARALQWSGIFACCYFPHANHASLGLSLSQIIDFSSSYYNYSFVFTILLSIVSNMISVLV